MRAPVQIWCDECGVKIESYRHNLVQWSGRQYTGFRTKDFCGYPCAERYRDTAIATFTAQGGEP